MSLLQLQASEKPTLNVRGFLIEVALPLLETDWQCFGTIAFQLSGLDGGAFTLDLDEGELYEGALDDADCLVIGPGRTFLDLVRGRIECDQALAAGVMVHGNLSVLDTFGEMLERGGRS